MRWAFEYMQQPGGSSVSLRLSTRLITQLERPDDLYLDGLGPVGSPADTYEGMWKSNVAAIIRGLE